jgi:hypothetical protein
MMKKYLKKWQRKSTIKEYKKLAANSNLSFSGMRNDQIEQKEG